MSAFEQAVFISLLQQVAQVGFTTFTIGILRVVGTGAGNLQRGGERDGATLYAFDEALLALLQQKDDVAHVFGGQTRLLDDHIRRIAPLPQQLDVGQDLQWPLATAGDVFGQAHDEGVFIAHVH